MVKKMLLILPIWAAMLFSGQTLAAKEEKIPTREDRIRTQKILQEIEQIRIEISDKEKNSSLLQEKRDLLTEDIKIMDSELEEMVNKISLLEKDINEIGYFEKWEKLVDDSTRFIRLNFDKKLDTSNKKIAAILSIFKKALKKDELNSQEIKSIVERYYKKQLLKGYAYANSNGVTEFLNKLGEMNKE